MGVILAENDYGKARVRLLRVMRTSDHHDIKELTLSILFEGDFEPAHTKGDNRNILPTDTMKNTVYVLAKEYPTEQIEDFALHLIEHFLTYNPQVSRVRIEMAEHAWTRLSMNGQQHPSTFALGGGERRTALVIDHINLPAARCQFQNRIREAFSSHAK
jgi:urate oxidase